jgi:hypothetical protein
MAKFIDWVSGMEVKDVMEAYIEKFPTMFEGFDTSKIGFVTTRKKSGNFTMKLHTVKYPQDVWLSKVYIVEILEKRWKKLDQKAKNRHVFKGMCAIPQGAFDEQSKAYGKLLKPDIKMFMREYAAVGGVPNWEENPSALDPMDQSMEDIKAAIPVIEALPEESTAEDTASVTAPKGK